MLSSFQALLVLVSAFHYAPPVRGTYETAASKAGEAAAQASGVGETEHRIKTVVESGARKIVASIGVPDKAVATLLIAGKVVREKSVSVIGPKIASLETGLTAGLDGSTVNVTWRF